MLPLTLFLAFAALPPAPAPARSPARPARPTAQERAAPRADGFTFEPAARYRSDVSAPEALLGYPYGSRFSEHRDVVAAVRAIDAASDAVELVEYGRTPEGRPLLLALISSPANLARKEAIAAGLTALADGRKLQDPGEAARLADSLPAIVWLSYNVHGNEPSCTEAGLATLWHLAAADDEAARSTREQLLIVLDPCLNPDGRDRYVHWFQSVVGATPDPEPASREHDEPGPGGRVNRFHFDLNRDWAFATQDETRARLAWLQRLPPQVHVDFHEMYADSSYFFFPAALPRNLNLPASTSEWGERFGRGNAAAFDRHGWSYYTGEQFDLLYPGYGDSFPSLRGAIGMTYEQAGHSAGGLAWRQTDGSLLTLYDRIAHHFAASLATVETARAGRRELLDHWRNFHVEALVEGRAGPLREVALLPTPDRTTRAALAALLLRHGVEVDVAGAAFVARGVHGYDGRDAPERVLPEGTLLISMEQPAKRLAKALLEPRAAVERTTFYDISAWSLPYAFGVPACWREQPADVARTRLAGESTVVPGLGAPLAKRGGVREEGAAAAVAFVLPWEDAAAPAALLELLGAGVRARFLPQSFASAARRFPAGSAVIAAPPRSAAAQRAALQRQLAAIGASYGVTFEPIASAFTEQGPDLGSEQAVVLEPPRLVLLASDGAGFGEMRWLLERELRVPFSCVEPASLARLDLADWNLIVAPDGVKGLDDAKTSLEAFLKRGGSVVALGSAALWFTKERSGLTDVTTKPAKEEEKKDDPPSWRKIAQREREASLANMPGAFFEVELDLDHPLAFGLPERIPQLATGTTAFELHGGGQKVGRFIESGRVSGFADDEVVDAIGGRFWLVEASVGRGRVLLFSESPTFRLGFRGPIRVLYNALALYSR